MKNSILLFIAFAWMHIYAQHTQVKYLSGTDAENTATWDFYCSDGLNSKKWTSIEVPSCWEQQGFGKYNYGHVPFEDRLKEINAILKERTSYLNNLEKERQEALRFKKLEKDVERLKASIIHGDLSRNGKESERVISEILKQEKDPLNYPMITKRPEYRRVHLTAALLQNNYDLWMIQRPAQGVLRDMWEFPMLEGDIEEAGKYIDEMGSNHPIFHIASILAGDNRSENRIFSIG